MKNRTWAEINIDNLQFNIKQLKRIIGKNVHILAAVKANAYGHDSIEISKFLERDVSVFGVASIDEAIELRRNGIKKTILILSPVLIGDSIKLIKNKIEPNVFSFSYAKSLNRIACKNNTVIPVHIEIDSGMNRTGIDYRIAKKEIEKIMKLRNLKVEGIFSHFAESEKKSKFTIEQQKRYDIIIKSIIKKETNIKFMHIANSSAIVNLNNMYNLVRPGLMLYGYLVNKRLQEKIKLKPVMSLKTRIGQVKKIYKGDSVSYSRTYTAKRNMKIATTLIGYGDGYSRLLSNRAKMYVKKSKASIIGNVCMDLTMLDVSKINNVKTGDEVEVFGENISIDSLSKISGLLKYEILTGIGPRVPRIFIKNKKIYNMKNLMANANWR